MLKPTSLHPDVNAMAVDYFNQGYFYLHSFLMENGDIIPSRNGDTRELLNFKTIVKNPIKRCVGGYGRNINVFFLLAEALWIWAGRRDVEFLDTFNSSLKQYSDDGQNYHAPYGWRIRHWGQASENEVYNKHKKEIDQLADSLQMLNNNSEDRRVVWNIWNPKLDLNKQSKDLPCNDMVMFKVRAGKLYTTIQNRSNDLNLGLTTNIFQFSFISEIMARILGLELGDQVHNSQSLHLYVDTDLTSFLDKNLKKAEEVEGKLECDLYDRADPSFMRFNFPENISIEEKLNLVDFYIGQMITFLSKIAKGGEDYTLDMLKGFSIQLEDFSPQLYYIFKLLTLYTDYKNHHKSKDIALEELKSLCNALPDMGLNRNNDYMLLARNFFICRTKEGKEDIDNAVKSWGFKSSVGLF